MLPHNCLKPLYYIVSLILPDAKALLQAGTALFVALKGSILNNLPGYYGPACKEHHPILCRFGRATDKINEML